MRYRIEYRSGGQILTADSDSAFMEHSISGEPKLVLDGFKIAVKDLHTVTENFTELKPQKICANCPFMVKGKCETPLYCSEKAWGITNDN